MRFYLVVNLDKANAADCAAALRRGSAAHT